MSGTGHYCPLAQYRPKAVENCLLGAEEAASPPLCPTRHPPQSVAACLFRAARRSCRAAMTKYPQKITFAELREMGVDEVLIYCADNRYAITSNSVPTSGRTMSACPTSIRSSSVPSAADAAPTCGRSSVRRRMGTG